MQKKNPEKYEKTLTLKVSKEEHEAIKRLAEKEGMTIKGMIFKGLLCLYPEWRKPAK